MPDAMPWPNRYLGNPVLTFIGKLFFDISATDFHCGMRAFRKDKVLQLDLVSTGMEWASEMLIKARLAGLALAEVPVTLYKDGRNRPPHLRRWRDGWRHLRFMLLHSPKWLFFLPGLTLALIGILGQLTLIPGALMMGRTRLDVHTLLVMSVALTTGVQLLFVAAFAKTDALVTGILPFDESFARVMRHFSLERLLVVSLLIGGAGAAGLFFTFWEWYRTGFSDLDYRVTMRHLIPSLTMIAVAIQGIFNGFMLSLLFLGTRRPARAPLETERFD
jgi:hypothetical protein